MDNSDKVEIEYDHFNAPQFIDFEEAINGNGNENPEDFDRFFETHKEVDDFSYPNTQINGNVSSLEDIEPSIHLLNTPTKKYSIGGSTNDSAQRNSDSVVYNYANKTPLKVQENQDSYYEIGPKDLSMKEVIPNTNKDYEDKENVHRSVRDSSVGSINSNICEDVEKMEESFEDEARKSQAKSKFYLRDSLVAQLGKLSLDSDETESVKNKSCEDSKINVSTSSHASEISQNSNETIGNDSNSKTLDESNIADIEIVNDETENADYPNERISLNGEIYPDQIYPNGEDCSNFNLSGMSFSSNITSNGMNGTSMMVHIGEGDTSDLSEMSEPTLIEGKSSSNSLITNDGGSERSSYCTALDLSFTNRTPTACDGLSPYFVEVKSISRNTSLIVAKHPVGQEVNWTPTVNNNEGREIEVEIANLQEVYTTNEELGKTDDSNEIEVEIINSEQDEDPADISGSKNAPNEEIDDMFDHKHFDIEISISNSKVRQSAVGLGDEITAAILSKTPRNLRRVSSLSDLYKLVEAKRIKTPPEYGFIPRVGITIPKTPERNTHRMKWTQNASTLAKTPSAIPLKKTVPKSQGPSTSTATARNNFTNSAKEIKPKEARSKYGDHVPLAQAIAKFQKDTPDRFHTHPKSRFAPHGGASEPNVQGKSRKSLIGNSPSNIPVNEASGNFRKSTGQKRTLQLPTFPLPNKIAIKTTIPRPFNLSKPKDKTTSSSAKSNIPLKAFESLKDMGKETVTCSKTISKAPHFASDDRIKERQKKRSETVTNDDKTTGKSNGLSQRKIPTPTKIPKEPSDTGKEISANHLVTKTKPFSFEERDKEARKRHEEKIKLALEQVTKVKPFLANPLPRFNGVKGVPPKKPADYTAVEPFKLKVDERGAKHLDDFQRKIDEENRKLQELKEFHAQDPIVLSQKPFQPELNSKVTDPLDIQLNSDSRALEREVFDNNLRLKEQMALEKKKQAEAEMEENEKKMISRLREQTVHRANPFKINKFFVPKASSIPLTDPMSPAFSLLPSQRKKVQTSKLPTCTNQDGK